MVELATLIVSTMIVIIAGCAAVYVGIVGGFVLLIKIVETWNATGIPAFFDKFDDAIHAGKPWPFVLLALLAIFVPIFVLLIGTLSW